MKRIRIQLAALALALLLSACASQSPTPQTPAEEPESPQATLTGRIVSVQESTVLLAGQEDSGLYSLSLDGIPWTLDGADFDPQDPAASNLPGGSLVGALATIAYDGGIMESYPMQLGGMESVSVTTAGFDNLCGLYLTVLEDLWNTDNGLNSDITELGVDLSQTRLSQSEQAAVAWAFGQYTGLSPIQGTFEELAEQGYLTSEPLGDNPDGPQFWQWEDGCLFSIREQEDPVVFSLPAMETGTASTQYDGVRFDAEKWRSGLGAYIFSDCTAVSVDGFWNSYTIGSEAIS